MTFITVHPQYTNLKQSRSPRRVVHPKEEEQQTIQIWNHHQREKRGGEWGLSQIKRRKWDE